MVALILKNKHQYIIWLQKWTDIKSTSRIQYAFHNLVCNRFYLPLDSSTPQSHHIALNQSNKDLPSVDSTQHHSYASSSSSAHQDIPLWTTYAFSRVQDIPQISQGARRNHRPPKVSVTPTRHNRVSYTGTGIFSEFLLFFLNKQTIKH